MTRKRYDYSQKSVILQIIKLKPKINNCIDKKRYQDNFYPPDLNFIPPFPIVQQIKQPHDPYQQSNSITMNEHISSQYAGIVAQLKDSLSLAHIYKQSHVLTHLNPKMEITLHQFLQVDLLRSINIEEAVSIIKLIPFLQLYQRDNTENKEQIVRISYQNTSTLVVITGIYSQAIFAFLHDYIYSKQKKFDLGHKNNKNCKVQFHNDILMIIQCNSEQNALNLLKFLRMKKSEEERVGKKFIIPNKRLRICGIQQVFPLLMDLMHDYKCDHFIKCMERDNLERNSHYRTRGSTKALNYRLFTSYPACLNYNLNNCSQSQIYPSYIQEQTTQNEQYLQGQFKNKTKMIKNCDEDEKSESTSLNSQVQENKQTDKQIDDICPFEMYRALKECEDKIQSLG